LGFSHRLSAGLVVPSSGNWEGHVCCRCSSQDLGLRGVAAVMGPSTARAEQAAKLPTIGF